MAKPQAVGAQQSRNVKDFGKSQKCYACGYEGHIKTDPKCPARGKKCRKCK